MSPVSLLSVMLSSNIMHLRITIKTRYYVSVVMPVVLCTNTYPTIKIWILRVHDRSLFMLFSITANVEVQIA